MSHRVVITGLGAITPIGNDLETIWQSLQQEKSGIGPLTHFNAAPYKAKLAGQITNFDPTNYFPPHRLKRLDRYAQFAIAAAQQALKNAQLPSKTDFSRNRWGVSCGTALGGISNAENHHANFLKGGVASIPPALALQVFGGSAHSQIAIEFGLTGYSTTNSNSCASGVVAVGEAWRAIREGMCDIILAVGSEAPLCPLTFGAFDIINTMTTNGTYYCFDKRREGFIMGEGSACLICESLEHAQARNAKIYAEILGYALNNDGYHMTSPHPEATFTIECMQKALENSKIKPQQIDYINAHASGTKLNDASETKAIKAVFKEHSSELLISGLKPYIGHALGATGAIELLISCLALEQNWLPPTLNLEQPDHDCDLNYIPNHGISHQTNYILKNAFGFGGINSSLILSKYKN